MSEHIGGVAPVSRSFLETLLLVAASFFMLVAGDAGYQRRSSIPSRSKRVRAFVG